MRPAYFIMFLLAGGLGVLIGESAGTIYGLGAAMIATGFMLLIYTLWRALP